LKVIAHSEGTQLKEKVLIADDSISATTGKNIELVSYHFDHKVGRSILGNCYLQLGYHNGINFFPLAQHLYGLPMSPTSYQYHRRADGLAKLAADAGRYAKRSIYWKSYLK
jgi:hypothetical protein